MILHDKVYDILKWLVTLVFPSAATLYFALSQIWGLPFGEEVVGTITAITAFMGVVLGISSHNYKK